MPALPISSFQSTPSVGRATFIDGKVTGKYQTISIHALRGEGDGKKIVCRDDGEISIHALRGEGDPVTVICG